MQTCCLNCDHALHPQQRFCSYCGQKTTIHRLSFRDIWHDVIHYFTHADKSIFSLVRKMFYQPGIVVQEYISGKRQKYFRPLNFFLIVAGIVVFVTSFFYRPDDSRSRRLEIQAQVVSDPQKKKQMLEMGERIKVVGRITGKYSNVINMLAVPLLSCLFWLFYRKRFNYVESLVANMYITGFTILLYALIIVPLQKLISAGSFLLILFFCFEVLYRGWAFYQLSHKKTIGAAARAYGVSLSMSLFWIGLSYSLIAYYIRTGF